MHCSSYYLTNVFKKGLSIFFRHCHYDFLYCIILIVTYMSVNCVATICCIVFCIIYSYSYNVFVHTYVCTSVWKNGCDLSHKSGAPLLVPPSKYIKIFGPPEQKFLIFWASLKYFIPHLICIQHTQSVYRGIVYFT